MPSSSHHPDPAQPGPDSPHPSAGQDFDQAATDNTGPAHSGRERSALEAAEDAFGWLTGGPSPLRVPPVAGLPHGLGLRTARMRMQTGRMPAAMSSAVWAAVAERAQAEVRDRGQGSTWTVAVVGLALPDLARIVAAAALAYPGHPADLEAAALVGLITAVHRTPATADALSEHALSPHAPDAVSDATPSGSGSTSGGARWAPGLWHSLPRVLHVAATTACSRLVDALAVAGYVTPQPWPLPPPPAGGHDPAPSEPTPDSTSDTNGAEQ